MVTAHKRTNAVVSSAIAAALVTIVVSLCSPEPYFNAVFSIALILQSAVWGFIFSRAVWVCYLGWCLGLAVGFMIHLLNSKPDPLAPVVLLLILPIYSLNCLAGLSLGAATYRLVAWIRSK